jgi:YteA family regulatory protein
MEQEKLDFFKKKLLLERKRVHELINRMKENETINMNVEMSSELSYYDNHDGDLGSEMNDMARGRAFKEHEISIIKKIDDALRGVDDGTYGVCKNCGIIIPEERLEFIPYAQFCVNCQNELNSRADTEKANRGQEEVVLDEPFGYGYNDFDEEDAIAYDAEDSYQDVSIFNRYENSFEYHDDDDLDYVEPIEKISNAQYRSQLPD